MLFQKPVTIFIYELISISIRTSYKNLNILSFLAGEPALSAGFAQFQSLPPFIFILLFPLPHTTQPAGGLSPAMLGSDLGL